MSSAEEGQKYKRWYDHDPLLVEVLETLRSFQDELKAQAQIFIDKIAEEVGQETVNKFYEKVRSDLGDKFGNRWYDADPVVSKAVELLRIAPPDVQRKAAEAFLKGLKDQGIQLQSGNPS